MLISPRTPDAAQSQALTGVRPTVLVVESSMAEIIALTVLAHYSASITVQERGWVGQKKRQKKDREAGSSDCPPVSLCTVLGHPSKYV